MHVSRHETHDARSLGRHLSAILGKWIRSRARKFFSALDARPFIQSSSSPWCYFAVTLREPASQTDSDNRRIVIEIQEEIKAARARRSLGRSP